MSLLVCCVYAILAKKVNLKRFVVGGKMEARVGG